VGGFIGIIAGLYSATYVAASLLWHQNLAIWFVLVALTWSAITFILAHLAFAHLFGLIIRLLFKILTRTGGSILLVALGVFLMLPYSSPPDLRYEQAGGLVFLTSDSASKVKVDMAVHSIGDIDALLDVSVTVSGVGRTTVAVVGSGPSEFEAAAMTSGRFNARQTPPNEPSTRTQLPLVEVLMPLVDASDLVEIGDDGMRLRRDDTLSPEVPGKWFNPTNAKAFYFSITPNANEPFSEEFSFMLKLSNQSNATPRVGNLGQVGCPMYFTQAAINQMTAQSSNQPFLLPSLTTPLASPDSCDVRILIAQVSNSKVATRGIAREVSTAEAVAIKGAQTAGDLDLSESVNALTLPRTDWLIGDIEKQDEDRLWDIRFWVGGSLTAAGIAFLYKLYFRAWLSNLQKWASGISKFHIST
jgi:hypothetical protein